jgi:glycerophosphoryl diester phosphodiesterase
LAGGYLNLLNRVGRERLLFGHRGVPKEAPENTLAGFRRALELGLDGVELDVRRCGSKELVVFHDNEVNRLTAGRGRVADLTFEEIRRLDVGARFGEGFRGEKIALLEEVLELLGGKMLINIELKTKSIRSEGLEADVVALVQKMQLQSSVIFSSFNPFSIRRVKQSGDRLCAALLFADDQPVHLRRAWASNIIRLDGIHPRYPLVSRKLVQKARLKMWFMGTWTVDTAAEASRLYDAGVDIVITNRPAQLRQELGRELEKQSR